jgi:1-acyl-sn-glycerol-3-phosphate acyltransferase
MVVNASVWETGELARELHWLMATQLLDVRAAPVRVPRRWMAAVFRRFARVYGFGLVTPREAESGGPASGLRVAARYLAAGEPVGVLPEGTASAELREARPGVGAALAWLTRQDVPLVPVGIAEIDGVLTAAFGPSFSLPVVAGDKLERDRVLREVVMMHIARLLPPRLRGYYTAALSAES